MYKVIEILNGNTILVQPYWEFENKKGCMVIVNGYDLKHLAKTMQGEELALWATVAKNRLTHLLLGNKVKLVNPTKGVIATNAMSNTIACAVWLNDVDISNYFPDYKPKPPSFLSKCIDSINFFKKAHKKEVSA